LYGMLAQSSVLRKVIAFNLLGVGVFLVFGVVARRGAAAGLLADPVPQAMVITGLVVAFAATALALVLTLRLHQTTGAVTLAEDPEADAPPGKPGAETA
ncbi:MAG: NADH-quinone oxidoreductase subunit K, partial [Roseomonas sp.]|nr:NADH-quinone oxidoreductase subunit K [Roseomonas sp.]